METSLRYGKNSKSLKIHAKEKYPLLSNNTHLQVHAELDTRIGTVGYFSLMMRQYYPDLYAVTAVGVKYDRLQKSRYFLRGKKAFPVTVDGKLTFHIKAQGDFDEEFRQDKIRGAAELSWIIPNFKRDQDIRLKAGYESMEKVPYFQIRENNWTLNTDLKGKWSVRYDL